VRRPKLYFLDSGLACRLLHISSTDQVSTHPLWGALVETWCFGEVLKSRTHRAKPRDLWFWRSSDGHEVDLLVDLGTRLVPIEIKSGATPHPGFSKGLRKLRELGARDASVEVSPGLILYGGKEARPVGQDQFVPWDRIDPAIESAT
jgi:predicted AAA+ superfamily ATPase